MKHRFLLAMAFLLSVGTIKAQDSFEGVIEFTIEATTTDPSGVTEKMLTEIYGNRSEMYYSRHGDFKIKYSNSRSITTEAVADYFFVGKNYLYSTYSLKSKVDSTNVTIEPSELVSFEKQKNQKILGKDCECYTYSAIDEFKEPAKFSYCFSLDTPALQPERYKNYNYMYLGDFITRSQRPYLKFSYEIEGYSMTFTAKKLEEKEVDAALFSMD